MSASRHIALLLSFAMIMAWLLPSSNGQAFFVPGKKLSNGKPLMILLGVSPADLKKYPEGSIVVADSPLMGVNEFRLVLNKCRLLPATEKKLK
jgi:hypothetical protein